MSEAMIMTHAGRLSTQLHAAEDDPLRILVIGAGVAGVTLARLLRARGLHPVLVECEQPEAHPGYMLALMPMVDPVITALGLTEQYLARSVDLRRFRFRSHTGRPLRQDSVAEVLGAFGTNRGIGRGELLGLLGEDVPVTFGTTVTGLDSTADGVAASFHGSGAVTGPIRFDVVVAADGMHSATRGLVLPPDRVGGVDTGWGGWVVWAATGTSDGDPDDPDDTDDETDLGDELWGAGFFLGSYPVPGRLGIILAGPRTETAAGLEPFLRRVEARLTSARGRSVAADRRLARSLEALHRAGSPYFWSLVDRRAASWSVGRVVLLGDAAAGFLPTAGVGAGMAMESALALATRLGGADPHEWIDRSDVTAALAAYERDQRPRVEGLQTMSRRLARLVLRRGRLLATARDFAVRTMSVRSALRPIARVLADRG